MKVMPIKLSQSSNTVNNNLSSYDKNIINRNNTLSFKSNELPPIIVWEKLGREILEADSIKLRELGEYFHKQPDKILRKVSKATKYLVFKDTDASQQAYKLLSDSINNVIQIKSRLISRISELGIKEAMGLENISEQKTNLQNFFINPIIAEKQGLKPPIDDGILIYGTSKGKDSFINWLKDAAPVSYKEMQFDEKAPIASLEELVKNAKNGKTIFDLSGQRTLLNVKDIDKFLADFDTPEKRGNIGHFKAFAETLSNDYHTTIITKTDLNPETFESAAFERFGIPVELKDGISKSELEELKSARSTVERMDDRAREVEEKFATAYEAPIPGDYL